MKEKNIIYNGIFVDEEKLKIKYKPIHENLFYHHSRIEFKPNGVSAIYLHGLLSGQKINLKIKGRLTTDKVDVLIVDNRWSKNKFPHITLSTAKGVEPFESNSEIENNLDKVQPLDDEIEGSYDAVYE